MRTTSLKIRLIPIYAALAFLLAPLAQQAISTYHISAASQAAQTRLMAPQPARLEGAPSRILIPSASIDLPVVKGSYAPASNSWSVADDAANYALNTALLNNQKGETLIYGHNTRKVFGSILNMTPGDEVYVYSENNHVFRYHFTGSQNIDPARTDIFKTMTAGPPGLKLITCDGANFEYRHLMSFTLVGSS